MGRDRVEFKVVGYVSRHNSDQYRVDDLRWQELQKKVWELVDFEYSDLDADVI